MVLLYVWCPRQFGVLKAGLVRVHALPPLSCGLLLDTNKLFFVFVNSPQKNRGEKDKTEIFSKQFVGLETINCFLGLGWLGWVGFNYYLLDSGTRFVSPNSEHK